MGQTGRKSWEGREFEPEPGYPTTENFSVNLAINGYLF